MVCVKKRKVLMISWAYYPRTGIGSHRIGKFVKYLRDFGWEPTVLTVREYNYPQISEELREQIPKDVKVIRSFDITPRILARMLRQSFRSKKTKSMSRNLVVGAKERTFSDFLMWFEIPMAWGWLPSAVFSGLKAASDCDVIWASSPPTASVCIGAVLSKLTGKPFVADFRDPWKVPGVRPYPTGFHRRIDELWQRFVFKTASRVVVAAPEMESILSTEMSRYPGKITHIYNGYDEDDFQGLPESTDSTNRESLKIGYLGTMVEGYKEHISAFLQAVKLMNNTDKATVYFRGPDPVFFSDLAASTKSSKFTDIAGIVPYKQGLALMCQMDILLVIRCEGYLNTMPAKIFEYIGARKPILAITPEGALSKFIERYNIGISLSTNSYEEIVNAIKTIKGNYDFYLSNLDAISDKFTRKAMTQRLSEIMSNTIAEK